MNRVTVLARTFRGAVGQSKNGVLVYRGLALGVPVIAFGAMAERLAGIPGPVVLGGYLKDYLEEKRRLLQVVVQEAFPLAEVHAEYARVELSGFTALPVAGEKARLAVRFPQGRGEGEVFLDVALPKPLSLPKGVRVYLEGLVEPTRIRAYKVFPGVASRKEEGEEVEVAV